MNGAGCVQVPPHWDSQAQSFECAGDGVALDTYHHIYTTDGHPFGRHRICRMRDMTGADWITFGSRGSGANQFEGPTGIAVVGMDPSPYKWP